MDVVDDSDGLAETEAELAPCPYCDGNDCKHEVLWHSRCNCDWDGLLADKTKTIASQLETALGGFLEVELETWPEEPPSEALLELIELAAECFDGTRESLEGCRRATPTGSCSPKRPRRPRSSRWTGTVVARA